jgi:phospholipase/lecithinase/hemolysin
MKKSGLWIAAASIIPCSDAAKFNLESFSSLVVFGDSYTDQGIYSYIPSPNGSLPNPVR